MAQLTLGDQTYTKTELLTLLDLPVVADASVNLAHQLIAAKLNALIGAPISVADVAQADSLLSGHSGRLPYGTAASSAAGQQMVAVAGRLEVANSVCDSSDVPTATPVNTVFGGERTPSATPVNTVLGRERPRGLPSTGGGTGFTPYDWGWLVTFVSLGLGAAVVVVLRNTVFSAGDDD